MNTRQRRETCWCLYIIYEGIDVWTRMDTSLCTQMCVRYVLCPGLGIVMSIYGDVQACGCQREQMRTYTSSQISAFVSPAATSEGAGPGPPEPRGSGGHGLPPPARAAPLRGPSAVSIAAPGFFPSPPLPQRCDSGAAARAGPRWAGAGRRCRRAEGAPAGPRGARAAGGSGGTGRGTRRRLAAASLLCAEALESVCARTTAQ